MKHHSHILGNTSRQLGPLEQRLLEELWLRRDATVRELIEGPCQDLAYTTVMTTLDRLFKKGILGRQIEATKAFRYQPLLTREDLHRGAAAHAFRQLLEASSGRSVPLSFLVEMVSERDAQLLDDLSNLVESKRRELAGQEKRPQTKRRERTRKENA